MKGGRGGTEAVVFFGAVVSHPPPGCVFAVVKCGICLCRALKRQKGERGGEGGLGTPLDVFVVSRPLRGFVYVVQPVVYVARVLER